MAYVCDAVAPVAVPPSPKAHAKEAMVPSGSELPLPSTDAVRKSVEDPKSATGGTLAGRVTVTSRVVLAVAPWSSVTVRVIVWLPSVA